MLKSITATVAVLSAAMLAGCGSSPSTGASSGGAQPNFKTATADAYKYADCMRSHGVTNFSDPKIVNGGGHQGIGFRVDPSITNSPSFKSAQKTCAPIMPGMNGSGNSQNNGNSPAHVADIMSFIRCLRTHGFPNFPDPDSQGRLDPATLAASGVNIHQPGFLKAGVTCLPTAHGALSRASLDQAVAGTGGGGTSSSG